MTVPRSLLRPLPCAVMVVVLTAAYLAGPARDMMDLSATCAVLVHIVLGILLIVPVGWTLVCALRRASGRRIRLALLSIMAVAGICALTGIYLAVRAGTGRSTAHDALAASLHNLTGAVAVLLVLVLGWLEYRRRSSRPTNGVIAPFVAASCILFSLTQGALFGAAALLPAYNAEEYYRDLTATTAEQAENPFFPAGIRLKDAHSTTEAKPAIDRIPDSSTCGVSGCHPKAYAEWNLSAHHLSGTDPFYRASVAEEIKDAGPEMVRWCQGCHAPVAALRSALSDGAHSDRSPGEAEGVGCYACHAMAAAPSRTGNGRYALARPQDYPFANGSAWQQALHAFLIRVRPGPHQRAFLKPALHRSAEFCSSCHRQSTTVAQNHYQFVRGPDEYGEWARGPAAGLTVRSSGSPVRETCQDCHFHNPADAAFAASVTHSAPGANTALAELIRPGSPVIVNSRGNGSIGLDLFAIRPPGPSHGNETWIAPLDRPRSGYSLRPGTSWWLDVVVSNRSVGHSFPAGYPDLTQAWLEVTVSDGSGRSLGSNGRLTASGTDVPRDAHVYSALGLNRTGSAILRHTQTQQVTIAYQRTIPAGGSDVARFRLTIPVASRAPSRSGALRVHVRLLYRSVRPDFARWALATVSPGSSLSTGSYAPPVAVLAETELRVPLFRASMPTDSQGSAHPEDATRFESYGNGLLAPGDKPDVSGAVRAFYAAGEVSPGRPEPWLGLGRAYLREPDLRLAAVNFERALRCSPGLPAAVSELSVVYTRQGQPERAIQALMPLAATFPSDGELRYNLGLALFRAGRYPEAADAFRHALAIDPDQYAAHFELKRCCELMRRTAEARLEDSVTRYMGEDRAAARLVPAYLRAHSEAAYRAEPFPVHPLN